MKRRVRFVFVTILISTLMSAASWSQSSGCRDIADEPNHQLLYQDNNVRIFRLDLPRIKTTEQFCVVHPFIRVAATDGRISDLIDGGASWALDWKAGEARYVYEPKKKAIRNELGTTYREYVAETLRTVQFNPLDGNTDVDILAGDLGPLKPTWSVSASRGALTITKNQLTPGASVQLGSPDHFLIALTSVDLSISALKMPAGIVLSPGDSQRIAGGMDRELKNQGSAAARFVMIEF